MALFSPRARPRRDDGNGQATTRERRGLRASAVGLRLDNRKALAKQTISRQEWQEDAWACFDDIGEIKFPARLSGSVMSKLKFFVAVRPLNDPEGDPIPASDPESGIPSQLAARATAELERLKSPFGGRAEIVRMLQINLEVVAEAYLVGLGPRIEATFDVRTGEQVEQIVDESWEIKSIDEVSVEADGKVKIRRSPGESGGVTLDEEMGDRIIRIWERHPRFSYLPDCAMRGVLGICESLTLLENQVKAIARSHQSAGFFTLPNELEKMKSPAMTPEGEVNDEEETPFIEQFNATLMEPVEDPASAASVAPMPLTGPAEYLTPDYVRHISLHRPSDDQLDARIEGRVLRVARGLNHPVETTTGLMATTFANASQVDEDKFKDHYEPRAVLMCDAFSVAFLQPNLIEAGENPDLVERLFVWFDPTALLKGANPIDTAKDGWLQGILSDEAWRRVNGWTEDDAPSDEERLIRAILQIRSVDPGVSTAVLELLGVPLDLPDPAHAAPPNGQAAAPQSMAQALLMLLAAHKAGQAPGRAVTAKVAAAATPEAVRAAKRANGNVGRLLMDLDRDLRTKLLIAAHDALVRSLEKAGNRIKNNVSGQLAAPRKEQALIRAGHPRYVAATLGQARLGQAGFDESELIGADAWDALEQQFLTWGAAAQATAVNLASSVVGLSIGERSALRVAQATNLTDAWQWMKESLAALAELRLYAPDPQDPNFGEFDPNSSVPTGLVRQAIARAGGATGLIATASGLYVMTNNGLPPGGIGTGELIGKALTDGGAHVEAYEWVYGPAFRARPFEEHEALDGTIVESLVDDDKWAAGDGFIDGTYYPGDHDGCQCDVSPVIVAPGGVVFNEATGEAHFADDQG